MLPGVLLCSKHSSFSPGTAITANVCPWSVHEQDFALQGQSERERERKREGEREKDRKREVERDRMREGDKVERDI